MNEIAKLVRDLDMNRAEQTQSGLASNLPEEDHNDECVLSEEELFEILESEDYESGLARVCGPKLEPDNVDIAIHKWIDRLAENYEDDSASQAVFDAFAALCSDGHLAEPPMVEADPNEKQEWISVFNQLIDVKLRNMGLEF